ncbi:hypothetical protein GCM10010168_03810 [Actinoplanes ianthinogenes]|uniref:Uncharacterized protein n=1 Tax=Actinoplanes ianthinogenes TaxID=122358 RepID=A0ABM7LU98_9ACTN|nr:hypothetical protein [Actinoplanes ianthinogenes]BCJ42879.1 hypothetical protein Aiant_35360 [Actinoplanes ianthinogenes]GGQ91623.1 hypothetical protein GCM10010168_03810 [Actinoplanes ianthinogenes]
MLVEVMRHVLYIRRLEIVTAWRDAERQQATEHESAVRRIIAQDVPDPSGRRAER